MSKKIGRWLVVAGIILIGFCAYFYLAGGEIVDALLREKVLEKQLDVDLICEQIDKFIKLDEDWGKYDYIPILSHDIEHLDKVPGTFAALYNTELETLSAREPTYTTPFEPTEHPEFVEAVQSNRSGTVELWFEAEDVPGRAMYLYYRWVPTDESLSGQLLAVVAVSRYSVNTRIADWVMIGAAILILCTAVMLMATIIILVALGDVWVRRKGDSKWRAAI